MGDTIFAISVQIIMNLIKDSSHLLSVIRELPGSGNLERGIQALKVGELVIHDTDQLFCAMDLLHGLVTRFSDKADGLCSAVMEILTIGSFLSFCTMPDKLAVLWAFAKKGNSPINSSKEFSFIKRCSHGAVEISFGRIWAVYIIVANNKIRPSPL
jgi:hypothetical protein